MNRLHLAKSYHPGLRISGDSQCDDVRLMRDGLEALQKGKEVQVGSAGTVLRFLALRASRLPGQHKLVGTERLFERPQLDILKILRQLGVEGELKKDHLTLKSDGWKLHGDTLLVPFTKSSQFASSVLLNSWDLPFDLFVSLGGQKISEGYWRMSLKLAQDLGMRIDFWDGDFRVPKGQKVTADEIAAEMDVSSAFVLAAIAAVSGSAHFPDFPEHSLQPDVAFVPIMGAMGVPIHYSGTTLKVEKAGTLRAVAADLKTCPDLFPVLAALCALAEGESLLYGAPQLAHKESHRIQKVNELLVRFGRQTEMRDDGLKISGPLPAPGSAAFEFDCDQDHRLAFAAAVLRAAGHPVKILTPEVVSKSFPEFWQILGDRP
ncbi:MAG: 3-phosphoshikimate 1-carboxyvinyltransferase [Bdellovibrionales bacterium]